MNIRKVTFYLHSTDVVVIAFGILLSIVNAIFSDRIPNWWVMILVNCGVSAAICWLAYNRHITGSPFLALLHDWYVAPLVFLTFKELYFMIKPIHYGRDYDQLLIAIDRWMFGVDPTRWLTRIANPYLTEILQVAYTSFYFLFLVLGYDLHRRNDPQAFHFFMFTCVYGFYISYIGYFFLPAVGPRFTLHDFSSLNTDLPGVFLTPYMRWFVNAGGSVPMGVPNEVAIAATQRDVFPSGHTMMTLVLMYLSARFSTRVRYGIYVTGTLLIMATVYERYHYVIDLIAGAVCMMLCVFTAPRLYESIKRRLQTMEARFP